MDITHYLNRMHDKNYHYFISQPTVNAGCKNILTLIRAIIIMNVIIVSKN